MMSMIEEAYIDLNNDLENHLVMDYDLIFFNIPNNLGGFESVALTLDQLDKNMSSWYHFYEEGSYA